MQIEDNIAVQMCLFPHAAATSAEMLANDDNILKQWADGRPLYLWLYAGLTTGHKNSRPPSSQNRSEEYGGTILREISAGWRPVAPSSTAPHRRPTPISSTNSSTIRRRTPKL